MFRDISKAKRVIAAFVAGAWSALWEDMIAKHSKRPEGCLIDALGIPCLEERRESVAKLAANAIRARFRRTSDNRNEWDRKKGKWTDSEFTDIIEIVESTIYGQLRLSRPTENTAGQVSASYQVAISSDALNSVPTLAMRVVEEFGKVSFNASNWEKMIGNGNLAPHGCLIDAVGIKCPEDRLEEVKLVAAQALRAKYPAYTESRVAWERKQWSTDDLAEIVSIVERAVREQLAKPHATTVVGATQGLKLASPSSSSSGVNGFVPWRPFRERFPVSRSPGVYLFAHFENGTSDCVDPLSSEVIYIGIAEGQATGDRLDQFERTALGGLGHTGGFSYRTDFARDVFQNEYALLRTFHNTYCSWIDVPETGAQTPRMMEESLLRDYRERWGNWPRLNKKG